MHDLLILGAGGHGRTLYETARLLGYKDIVFLDDNTSACQEINQLIIGKISELQLHIGKVSHVAIGIGNNKVREQLYQQLLGLGIHPVTLIHPFAFVSPSATLAEGTVVLAGAVVGANAKLGLATIVNSHSTIDHDAILGDFAHHSW